MDQYEPFIEQPFYTSVELHSDDPFRTYYSRTVGSEAVRRTTPGRTNSLYTPPLTGDSISPLAWKDGSRCSTDSAESFFPEKGGSYKNAKEICSSCEVREQCLAYALVNDEQHGMWGGMTVIERKKLKRHAARKQ